MSRRNRDPFAAATKPRSVIQPWVWPLLAIPVLAMIAVVGGIIWFATSKYSAIKSPAMGVSQAATTDSPRQPPASRKTFARDEVRDTCNWIRTQEGIMAKFGPPDKTTEYDVPWQIAGGGGGADHVVAFHYYKLSVDAKGSGKVDSEVVIKFGTSEGPQFIP